MSIFERGDIVSLPTGSSQADPITKREGENWLCLVLSSKVFNSLGSTLVAPISQSQASSLKRISAFAVPLEDTEMSDHVLISGVRMINMDSQNTEKVGHASESIVDEVLARLQAVID